MILMRLPWAVGSLCVALAMLLAGHTVSYGQTVVVDPRTGQFYQQRAPANPYGTRPASPYQRQVQPPQQAPRGGYYPGMLVQPAPQPQPGFSLRRLFGIPDAPRQAVIPQQAPRVRADRPRPPPAVAAARPEKPKVDPSTYVVVFGDALADLVGQGLDDGFSETPDVAVVRKVRADTGLVRSEVADWPRQIQEILNGGQKITLAVVMLGTNDRQPIKEGDASYDVLTDRWQDLYRQRVDAVARVFQERAIPLVWVGLPPMKNDQLSADLIAMNEIYPRKRAAARRNLCRHLARLRRRGEPLHGDRPRRERPGCRACAPVTACSSRGPAPARPRISPIRRSSGSSMRSGPGRQSPRSRRRVPARAPESRPLSTS